MKLNENNVALKSGNTCLTRIIQNLVKIIGIHNRNGVTSKKGFQIFGANDRKLGTDFSF